MADKEYGFEETMVTLTDEDGQEKDFYVDEIYEVDGRLYAAVIPSDVENVTEYYVFRLIDLGNDDFEMEDIEEEASMMRQQMRMRRFWIPGCGTGSLRESNHVRE